MNNCLQDLSAQVVSECVLNQQTRVRNHLKAVFFLSFFSEGQNCNYAIFSFLVTYLRFIKLKNGGLHLFQFFHSFSSLFSHFK